MNARLVRELATILEQPAELAEQALAARLSGARSSPPVAELVELGARARERRATADEVGLAVGVLLAFYAGPAGTARR